MFKAFGGGIDDGLSQRHRDMNINDSNEETKKKKQEEKKK
jgi:hypothetical protein